MYALESRDRTLLWQRLVPGVARSLLVMRDGRSDISEAVAMLVYKHHRSTYFTLMFNPVTGDVISDDPCDLDLDQALLLPETHSDLPRPVLLVGVDNSAMILPSAAMPHLVKEMPRLFVMTERDRVLVWNMATITKDKETLFPVWNMVTSRDKIITHQQSNATTFFNIDSEVVPLVERQAYILPLDIVALEETMTTKGITSKHLLVATTDGSVLDLPMHMLDPRRPAPSTPANLREPGIPPYIPELPS